MKLKDMYAKAGVRQLLSKIDSNPKVKKNGKLGVLTAVLHLAPGNMSGHEVCPKRSAGCSAACLHFAGSPIYQTNKTKSRIAKTQLLFRDRDLFMNILALEMHKHIAIAEKRAMEPAFRLNGTSDICWELKKFRLYPEVEAKIGRSGSTILELFPDVQFYDYTAIPRRNTPANYHLTFSAKENNSADVLVAINNDMNVAVVFQGALPTTYLGLPVIDGDEHDYRPADPARVIVGLKVKGTKGKADSTGFVNLAANENTSMAIAA